jgi:hypothetical protein
MMGLAIRIEFANVVARNEPDRSSHHPCHADHGAGDHLKAVRSLTMFGLTRISSPRPLKTRPPRFEGALAQKNK